MNAHLGLDSTAAQKTAHHLEVVLANTFVLYTKTLNFHWNVEGPNFMALHTLFQGQYESLAGSIDEIAESVRTLGFKAPGTLVDFLHLTTLHEEKEVLKADEMLEHLLQDYESIIAYIRASLDDIDEKDIGSRTLLEGLLVDHEKTSWILASHLKE